MTKRNREKIKTINDESIEIVQFVKVLGIVVVCIVGVYFFTRLFVTKDLLNEQDLADNSESTVEIDYKVTTVGAMLNRPYTEYYVMIYKSDDKKSVLYDSIRNKFITDEDSIKIYYIDLSTRFNEDFYSAEQTNPKAKTVEDLRLGDLTLIKVKNGKITSYLEDYDKIKTALKVED